MVAGLLAGVPAAGAAAQAGQPLTVEVLLVDHGGVPATEVAEARGHAWEIFAAAGVDLVWTTNPGTAAARRVVVFLLPHHPDYDGSGPHDGDVLGRATPRTGRALVFTDRVGAAVRKSPVSPGVALGQVLAHEIGHLLLPTRRHAHAGVMRARLDFDRPLFVRFTKGEAAAIEAALGQHASVIGVATP
jgi:hypothetical protein